jgi:phage tail protein X
LDEVAQSVYGFQSGAVEALLAVNPGLATLACAREDFVLPRGVAIILPQLLAASSTTGASSSTGEVNLWR